MEIPTLPEEEKWEMMREIFVLNNQRKKNFKEDALKDISNRERRYWAWNWM